MIYIILNYIFIILGIFKYRKTLGNCSEDAGKFVLDAPCAEEP